MHGRGVWEMHWRGEALAWVLDQGKRRLRMSQILGRERLRQDEESADVRWDLQAPVSLVSGGGRSQWGGRAVQRHGNEGCDEGGACGSGRAEDVLDGGAAVRGVGHGEQDTRSGVAGGWQGSGAEKLVEEPGGLESQAAGGRDRGWRRRVM